MSSEIRASPDARVAKSQTHNALAGITALLFAIPLAAYLWMITHYSVNAVITDQWADVNLLRSSYAGHLTLGHLWRQHNENRIFFPNLIAVSLDHLTAMNVVAEDYLSALLLLGAITLLIVSCMRRSGQRSLLAYTPVALLLLSPVQAENALWGFQMAWYLVLLMFAVVIFALDRKKLGWVTFFAAALAAVVGSYSSLQGLFIWVAGALLLYLRKRPAPMLAVWVGAAALTTAFYFHHYNAQAGIPASLTAVHHPGQAVRSFFLLIGDIVGVPLNSSASGNTVVLIFGVFLFALAVYALSVHGIRRDAVTVSPIGVAMIVFGLLFAASVAYSRAGWGDQGASLSRYTTFDLLIPLGTYLVLLPSFKLSNEHRLSSVEWRSTLIGSALIGAMVIQIFIGYVNGFRAARAMHAAEESAVVGLVAVDHVPDTILSTVLTAADNPASQLRADANFLRSHRLGIFASNSLAKFKAKAAHDESLGLFDGPPAASILRPTTGTRVSGVTVLDAGVNREVSAKFVHFVLLGTNLQTIQIGSGTSTRYGWILRWNTTTVPNGTYELGTVVHATDGWVGEGETASVVVGN